MFHALFDIGPNHKPIFNPFFKKKEAIGQFSESVIHNVKISLSILPLQRVLYE
jgi:hypothetical protein